MQKKKIARGDAPGTIKEFGNAVSAAAAMSKRGGLTENEDDDVETGRGDEPLLKGGKSKKKNWYGM